MEKPVRLLRVKKEGMMVYTLLTAQSFAKVDGISKGINAGMGLGRNVNAVKQGAGMYYFRLSDIADPSYNGYKGNTSNERFIRQVEALFKEV